MPPDIDGIHHVSTIVRDARANRAFYTRSLGLRFVTRTVDFEDRFAYHLYYGDSSGRNGTVLTFFPFPDEVDGRVGRPQIASAALAVPEGSLDVWTARFDRLGVEYDPVEERFGEPVLPFRDPDGTHLELVEAEGVGEPWTEVIENEYAIRGIHGVSLLSAAPFVTASLLETFGLDRGRQEGDRVRYRTGTQVVDLLDRETAFGREGAGTHHHVAFAVPDEAALHDWRDILAGRDDCRVSYVTDRHFFHSLYVRGDGGILFELATASAGMAEYGGDADGLYLPPQFEEDREVIESQLPPLE
ncbi:VOC family protein [Natronomonas sp. EA1]|uniref:VOC family protein n=1 Tax=Natronomonas sp. EA1 TaxID=3421655 RepID=UPI003EB797DC